MSGLPSRSERGIADLMVALDASINTMELREKQRDEARQVARVWEDACCALDAALLEAVALVRDLWEAEVSYPSALWERMTVFLRRHQ